MIRKAAVLAVFALIAAAPGAALHAQTPPPAPVKSPAETIALGYWKITASALLILNDSEYRCVGPEDIQKFFDGPCKNHSICTYPVKQVGGGKAKYVGYMEDRHKKRTSVEAQGTYSAKRFALDVKIQGIPVPGKITAVWQQATCPAGAKH